MRHGRGHGLGRPISRIARRGRSPTAKQLSLGKHEVRWLDAPHLPHNWECGYLFEASTRTLLCGDLFTHGGADVAPLTEHDVLGPSEAMRKAMGGVAIEAGSRAILEKLARTEPTTLALMHGSSFRGDGRAHLLGARGRAWRVAPMLVLPYGTDGPGRSRA